MEHVGEKLRADGVSPGAVKKTMSVLGSLHRACGNDLATATAADLMQWASVHSKELHTCARRGLRYMFTDAERRWPEFFRFNVFGSKFKMAQLKAEVANIPNVNMDLVDMDVIKRAMEHRSATGIPDVHTLYMRCWCTAFDQFDGVPPRVCAMMLLRWGGDGEILEVFRRMARSAVEHGQVIIRRG